MFKSKRTYVNIGILIILLGIPFVPWYVIFVLSTIAAWYYTFYEFIYVGLLLDLLYASKNFGTIFGEAYPLPCTTAALIILIILHLLKKRVRF